ncbi:MAG: hypothetical protein U0223_12710 [Nitrospira sp.]
MTTNPSAREPVILRIGQHLAQLSAGRTPTVFDSRCPPVVPRPSSTVAGGHKA